MKGEHTF